MSREKLKNVAFSLEILKQFAKERYGSLKNLAEAMGISQPQLSLYLSGKREFGASMRDRLEDSGFFDFLAGLNKVENFENKPCLNSDALVSLDIDGAEVVACTPAERLAMILGIPLDTLRRWQSGEDSPTITELARLFNLVVALSLSAKQKEDKPGNTAPSQATA